MTEAVSKALENAKMTYNDLIAIADDMFHTYIGDLDKTIQEAYEHIEMLTNDAIRDLLLRLSLRSYSFAEIKERAVFKAALAESLRKEAYSRAFNATEGSVAVRDNIALVSTSAEFVTEELLDLVSNMFRTKVDEIHRIVSTMQTVLMSRLSEAKLVNVTAD